MNTNPLDSGAQASTRLDGVHSSATNINSDARATEYASHPAADSVQRLLAQARVDRTAGGNGDGRELVTVERNVDAGNEHWDKSARNAYDMELYREPDGRYTLEVKMDVEVAFLANERDDLRWSEAEKQGYLEDFKSIIENVWSGHTIQIEKDGQTFPVGLDIDLNVTERTDHWRDSASAIGYGNGTGREMKNGDYVLRALNPVREADWIIEAVPLASSDFARSFVSAAGNMGRWFGPANDVVIRENEDHTRSTQFTVAHEFGHLLGLYDEYEESTPHTSDHHSIMHSGNNVHDRHLQSFEAWLEDELPPDTPRIAPDPGLQAL